VLCANKKEIPLQSTVGSEEEIQLGKGNCTVMNRCGALFRTSGAAIIMAGFAALFSAASGGPSGPIISKMPNQNSNRESGAVISLPPIPGLEMPAEAKSTIAAEESPMKELLASASARGLKITHDRKGYLFPIGDTLVTWTAWEGEPDVSAVKAVKSGHVYVFKNGQIPVGLSLDDHATAGNHATKIARDSAGRIHMAWLDSGRPEVGDKIMYRRGVQDPVSGAIQWETGPVIVAAAAWDSHVALAVSANAVHFAWFQAETGRYRRLVHRDGAWSFEPLRDTKATGRAWDNGPDLAVRGDDEIHLLTAEGVYAISNNGGVSWTKEKVPVPAGASIKGPALDLDSAGNSHVIFTACFRNSKYSEWHYNDPNGAYWELRYVRRQVGGAWTDAQNVLAAFPEWSDFRRGKITGTDESWDSLADWADVAVDEVDNVHLAWHGPVNTHIFGNDEAYYTRRPASGKGSWRAWETPSALYPKDESKGHFFAYAPSLCTDALTKLVFPVVFFETTPGHPGVPGDTGDQVFNSIFRIVRDGILEGVPIELTSMAQYGMSTWFPCAAPRLFHHANGRTWLDVLQTTTTPKKNDDPFYFIIYQRREVTDLLQRSRQGSKEKGIVCSM
jgi:hypothetical protein